MQKYVDNLFYIFEENHFDKDTLDYKYLSAPVNKVLAFENWVNNLGDDDIASFLLIEVDKVPTLRDFITKGITIWLES